MVRTCCANWRSKTGGHAVAIGNVSELPDTAAKIGIELRNQYVLYYSPKNLSRGGNTGAFKSS